MPGALETGHGNTPQLGVTSLDTAPFALRVSVALLQRLRELLFLVIEPAPSRWGSCLIHDLLVGCAVPRSHVAGAEVPAGAQSAGAARGL